MQVYRTRYETRCAILTIFINRIRARRLERVALKLTSSFWSSFGDTFAYVVRMDISRSFVVEIFPNSLQVTREF